MLLGLGVSGAWIGTLTKLEPYRPLFIGVALIAVVSARRRIFRHASDCAPGELCAVPQVRTAYRVLFWVVAVLLAVALAFPFIAPFFY